MGAILKARFSKGHLVAFWKVGSKMPPPDTREILENPPENRAGTIGRDSQPLRIAPNCSGAILKHNLSQGRTTMQGRPCPNPSFSWHPLNPTSISAERPIKYENQGFVAVRPKLKPPRICCLLLGLGWRPVNKCALLALLSLIWTRHPAAGLFSESPLPTIRNSLRAGHLYCKSLSGHVTTQAGPLFGFRFSNVREQSILVKYSKV